MLHQVVEVYSSQLQFMKESYLYSLWQSEEFHSSPQNERSHQLASLLGLISYCP